MVVLVALASPNLQTIVEFLIALAWLLVDAVKNFMKKMFRPNWANCLECEARKLSQSSWEPDAWEAKTSLWSMEMFICPCAVRTRYPTAVTLTF